MNASRVGNDADADEDEAFLEDVRRAPAFERSISLWWLGQSGFLLKYGNRVLAFDPYLSDSLTRKYEKTDKPLAEALKVQRGR